MTICRRRCKRQKLTLQPGDAVIVNTGWGRLWDKEGERYLKTNPGLTTASAEWLAKQDPMLIGIDNGPVGVTPDPDPNLNNPVHQIALVVHGIHLLENLKLDELAGKQVYEFAFIIQPLKIQGRDRVDGRADRGPVTTKTDHEDTKTRRHEDTRNTTTRRARRHEDTKTRKDDAIDADDARSSVASR